MSYSSTSKKWQLLLTKLREMRKSPRFKRPDAWRRFKKKIAPRR